MRAVVQRVSSASVAINQQTVGAVQQGLLVLLGISQSSTQQHADWLAAKIINMRIFTDTDGKMNHSVKEVGGNILLISQFTLHGSTKKGNRPSFVQAAKPNVAVPLYQYMIKKLSDELGQSIATGEFGANMQVTLTNDGPVTIVIDAEHKE